MRTPLQGLREPYSLPSNVIYFTDSRYIQPGPLIGWVGRDGKPTKLWATEEIQGVSWAPWSLPKGVRLVAQKAQKTRIVLTRDKPWEYMMSCQNMVYEEGRYRLWYECLPATDFSKSVIGQTNLLCYAESKDGFVWEKPVLNICEYGGNRNNNIVFDNEIAGEIGYHGGGIFKDPSSPPEERYKAIYLGMVPREQFETYRKARPDDVDPYAIKRDLNKIFGVYGAVSPDGLHWKHLPDPLVIQHSDTQTIAYYDQFLKKYVGYFRTWYLGRRSIGRAETDDFTHWPIPETIMFPCLENLASDLYTNAKTLYPGTGDYHLMFPVLYQLSDDSFEVHIASSADGIIWSFVPGGPVLSPGVSGAWDCGCVFAGCGLVPLPDNRVGLPYTGSPIPHKYPRSRPGGSMAYATWQKGRLAAIEAVESGEFSLFSLLVEAGRLKLNLRTKMDGHVIVEVADKNGHSLPGYSFQDADPISGDYLDAEVTWRGNPLLKHSPDFPIVLRFRMQAAEIFSVEFVS